MITNNVRDREIIFEYSKPVEFKLNGVKIHMKNMCWYKILNHINNVVQLKDDKHLKSPKRIFKKILEIQKNYSLKIKLKILGNCYQKCFVKLGYKNNRTEHNRT